MSSDAILAFLENSTPESRLIFQVGSLCAPVLKNLKVANLISTEHGNFRLIRNDLKKSRILCYVLYTDSDRDVLLLFRKDRLENILSDPKIRQFLGRFGYASFDIPSVLKLLGRRYAQYITTGTAFPDEVGVILGYPLDDVEGYIQNNGENSLIARYWKVYHNPLSAEKTFKAYDAAREKVLTDIVRGYSLDQVAV